MTMIKNYWVFTNWQYKLVMWLVFPLVTLGLNISGYFSDNVFLIVFPITMCFLIFPVIDVMSDYWLLPGFYARGNNSLEFLQSTTKFKSMIRDVVFIDIVRRALLYLVTFFVLYALFVNKDAQAQVFIEKYIYVPLVSIVVSQTAVFVSRFFRVLNQVFACAMLTMVANAVNISSASHSLIPLSMWIGLILVALAVAVIALTIGFSLKKVRDSYYDK